MSHRLTPDRLDQDHDPKALKRRSVHGAAMTAASQMLRVVLQFSAQIVLAHLLLPAEFGLVAMIGPILSLVKVFNELGLTEATVQRAEISHAELSALFWVNVGISVILAGAMALAAPLVAWFYGVPALVPLTACSALLLVFSGVSAQQIALMNRRMQYRSLATIDVTCVTVAVIVGIGAAALGFGAWSLVVMQAANSLTILALAWGMSGWRPSLPSREASVLPMLRFGGHLTGFNILGFIENNLGNVLLGRFYGSVAVGLFDRAFRLVIVPWWQVSLPIARVAVALLSRLRDAEHQYVRAHNQMLEGLLVVAVPGLIWAAIVAPVLVPLVLGAAWVQAVPIVRFFSLATTVLPFGASAYWLFVSQSRVREQLRYGMVSGGVMIIALLTGAVWGPIGMAKSYAAFAVLIQGVQLWGATRRGPVSLRTVLRAAYPVFVGALAAGALVPLGLRLLSETGVGLAVQLAASLALDYALCAICLLCFPDGARIIRNIWDLRTTLRREPALG